VGVTAWKELPDPEKATHTSGGVDPIQDPNPYHGRPDLAWRDCKTECERLRAWLDFDAEDRFPYENDRIRSGEWPDGRAS
jgi:hypothetical protein